MGTLAFPLGGTVRGATAFADGVAGFSARRTGVASRDGFAVSLLGFRFVCAVLFIVLLFGRRLAAPMSVRCRRVPLWRGLRLQSHRQTKRHVYNVHARP
jgi:hypothetical protein